MEEQEKLYCFKLNKDTGEIKKIEISNYERRQWNNGEKFFRYKLASTVYYAYEKDFDRFKNDRVYSLNDSLEDAIDIITNALSKKRDDAKFMLDKWDGLINRINVVIELDETEEES